MDSLREHADRIERAAVDLANAASALAAAAPAEQDFGVDAPGQLGELGRALHGQWAAAVDARIREAALAADLLIDAADVLRTAVDTYAETDDAARRRHAEES